MMSPMYKILHLYILTDSYTVSGLLHLLQEKNRISTYAIKSVLIGLHT